MAQDEENQIARAAEGAKLKAAVDAVLKTEEGRKVFSYLFNNCGYNKTSIVVNQRTGEVIPSSTQHNESRRQVYAELRGWATPELLSPVEVAAELAQRTSSVEKK